MANATQRVETRKLSTCAPSSRSSRTPGRSSRTSSSASPTSVGCSTWSRSWASPRRRSRTTRGFGSTVPTGRGGRRGRPARSARPTRAPGPREGGGRVRRSSSRGGCTSRCPGGRCCGTGGTVRGATSWRFRYTLSGRCTSSTPGSGASSSSLWILRVRGGSWSWEGTRSPRALFAGGRCVSVGRIVLSVV